MRARIGVSYALAASVLALSHAASAAAPVVGDAAQGATLAVACQACHGANGEGVPAAGFPRLAGQTAAYIEKQLADYVSGARNNPVMAPLAKTLDAKKRADLAAHFAALSPPAAALSGTPAAAAVLARGKLLSHQGDESKQLQACGNCHGPDGRGEPFAAPYLAGQNATYIAATIAEWNTGARNNDGGHLMAVVAGRLDAADIAAVAAYFESLGPLP